MKRSCHENKETNETTHEIVPQESLHSSNGTNIPPSITPNNNKSISTDIEQSAYSPNTDSPVIRIPLSRSIDISLNQ